MKNETYLRKFLEAVFPETAAKIKPDEPIELPDDMKGLYEVWCMENGKGGK